MIVFSMQQRVYKELIFSLLLYHVLLKNEIQQNIELADRKMILLQKRSTALARADFSKV